MVSVDRNKLFEEVWREPLSKLAPKYGLSDNGLRKVCISLDIPLPGRGHWAKIAAGHKVAAPALPASEKSCRVALGCGSPPSPPADEWQEWLAGRIAFERAPENVIAVAPRLNAPHRLVALTERAFNEVCAALEKSRSGAAARLQVQRRGARPEPVLNFGPRWSDYERRGHIPDLAADVLRMKVSISAGERALRIWDALIKACLLREMKVRVESRVLVASCRGQDVEIRISERIERKPLAANDPRRRAPYWDHHIGVATGELRILIGGPASATKITDSTGRPLEEQLNRALITVWQRFVSAYRQRCAAEIARQQQAEYEQRRAVAWAEAAERKLQAERALKLENDLVSESAAWRRAEEIRAYVAAVEAQVVKGSPKPMPAAALAWIEWASAVAKRLDPLPGRLTSFGSTSGNNEQK